MKRHLIFSIFLLAHFVYGQNNVYVSGNDDSNTSKGSPEIFIDEGQEGFLFIDGGFVANNATTGGTAGAIGTPNVDVKGGLFIVGDLANQTHKPLVFDYNGAGTASANAISGTLPTLSGATHGTANRGGVVHLMGGTQNITGLNASNTDDIIFYNLSLSGSVQDKNLTDIHIQVGVKGADATLPSPTQSGSNSDGTLFLHNNYLNTGTNVVWVRNANPANMTTSTPSTDGLAIIRSDGGDGTSGNIGMVSEHQNENFQQGMVTSTGNGRLARVTDGASTYLFPIGTSDKLNYRPMEIIGGPAGTYFGEVELLTPNVSSLGTPAPTFVNNTYYWRINSSVPNAAPQLRLYNALIDLNPIGPTCSLDELMQNVGIAQAEGNSYNLWTHENSTGNFPPPGDGDMGYTLTNSYNSVGAALPNTMGDPKEGFAIDRLPQNLLVTGVSCLPFPLELLNFSGHNMGSVNHLSWQTNMEVNTSHFVVEKSVDAQTFSPIGQVQAAGNANTPQLYTFDDDAPQMVNFYRLQMLDLDGTKKQSNTIEIRLTALPPSVVVFPNPFTEGINVEVQGIEGEVSFKLYNELGQEIMIEKWNNQGTSIQSIPLKALSKGVYVYRILLNDKYFDGKLTKAE